MTGPLEMHAEHVWDQTSAAVAEANDKLIDAIASRNAARITDAMTEVCLASYRAGWEQCRADLRVELARQGIDVTRN